MIIILRPKTLARFNIIAIHYGTSSLIHHVSTYISITDKVCAAKDGRNKDTGGACSVGLLHTGGSSQIKKNKLKAHICARTNLRLHM